MSITKEVFDSIPEEELFLGIIRPFPFRLSSDIKILHQTMLDSWLSDIKEAEMDNDIEEELKDEIYMEYFNVLKNQPAYATVLWIKDGVITNLIDNEVICDEEVVKEFLFPLTFYCNKDELFIVEKYKDYLFIEKESDLYVPVKEYNDKSQNILEHLNDLYNKNATVDMASFIAEKDNIRRSALSIYNTYSVEMPDNYNIELDDVYIAIRNSVEFMESEKKLTTVECLTIIKKIEDDNGSYYYDLIKNERVSESFDSLRAIEPLRLYYNDSEVTFSRSGNLYLAGSEPLKAYVKVHASHNKKNIN